MTSTRVLILHSSDELYGADRVLLSLVDACKSRVEFIVLLPVDLPYDGKLYRELLVRGVDVRYHDLAVARRQHVSVTGILRFVWRLMTSAVALRRLIHRERIEVVHSFTLAVWSGFVPAALSRRPHIWHVHESLRDPRWFGIASATLATLVSKRVVAVSRFTARRLLDQTLFGTTQLDVVYNGFDIEDVRNRSRTTLDEGVVSSADESVPIFLYVGRISEGKRPTLVLDVADAYRSQGLPPARWLLVGDSAPAGQAYFQAFTERALRTPGVEVLPFQDNVLPFYRFATALLLTSKVDESLPTVAVEAALIGCPIVSVPTGSIGEIVSHSQLGTVTTEADPAEIAAACWEFVGKEPERAECVEQSVYRRFSSKHFGARMLEIYKSVISHDR